MTMKMAMKMKVKMEAKMIKNNSKFVVVLWNPKLTPTARHLAKQTASIS